VCIAVGSGWTGGRCAPWWGFDGGITRRTIDGATSNGCVSVQRIGGDEVLYGCSLDGTNASVEDGIGGSLEPGKLADFVILDRNILETDPVDNKDIRIVETVVGGRTTYKP